MKLGLMYILFALALLFIGIIVFNAYWFVLLILLPALSTLFK